MSFRARLTLFFLLLVAVPMVVIAFLVSEVAEDSSTGKVDAALAEDLEIARDLYPTYQRAARRHGKRIGKDPRLQAAISSGEHGRIARRLREIVNQGEAETLTFTPASTNNPIGVFGPAVAIQPTRVDAPDARPLGSLSVSTTSGDEFARIVAEATGEEAVVVIEGATPSGTLRVEPDDLPDDGRADVAVGDEEFRAASIDLESGDDPARLVLLSLADTGGFLASRPGVAVALAAFIGLALLAAALITRALQGQVATMLGAARRIGEGDFSGEVPVVGRDELAGLASEFNLMRDRLSTQVSELRRQRTELEASVDRIGQAFASGLDRPQLLEILVETAVAASDAEYGLIALAGRAGDEFEHGTATEKLREAALAAEHRALKGGAPVSTEEGGAFALAGPLRGATGEEPIGVMTIARRGTAFDPSERSVFLYLAGQAAASVENLALHELVSRQAVTDELTGLANNRAFRDVIEKEAARAERFDHDLSLLMLDIDDFKQVNDTYGHLQGDAVLRAIGAILDSESRGIDEPARYGGEEFVVALPETALEGAHEFAERLRTAIESAEIRRVEGEGHLRVTASIGAAALPGCGRTAAELVAAADGALYEAKRAGKNRVVAAQGNGAGWRSDAE